MKTDLIKGFRDFVGEGAKKREAIRGILVELFEKYGFAPVETPIIEDREFVEGDNKDDEAVSDIYRLEDKGKRKLALRYEFTFQLKRLMQNQKLPFKRYQIGTVFRDEPVSGNRIRQFIQCDCDIVGSNVKDEAEIFAMAQEILKELEIDGVIYFNNRKLLNEILLSLGRKEENFGDIIKIIDKLDKLSEQKIKTELKKFGAEKVVDILKKPEKFFEKFKAYFEIKELKKLCKIYGVNVKFSPFLARGLSYYNGTIFEIKTKKMKETITGGGAFMFNNVQCFGISFGMFRLSQLAEIKQKDFGYLIVSLNQDKEAIKLAQNLRKKGKSVSMFYGKPSKAMEYANSYKINKVLFVGEREVKSKAYKVKDMKTGKESKLKV